MIPTAKPLVGWKQSCTQINWGFLDSSAAPFLLEVLWNPKAQENLKAVKNISIEVQPGEVFGLLGPNGAGKTSTLKIITAEQAPSSGKVFWFFSEVQ